MVRNEMKEEDNEPGNGMNPGSVVVIGLMIVTDSSVGTGKDFNVVANV